ncbi:coiled-coil domain-containing protein 12-like [Limulus polyphemus]|uniref:Coiled-coil domain-containing protein 12-like n=1 Tax=Limulus polyphemus TaxID=6850 RepID=A0ABM1SH20_LIMPO|nr:coiled-coil domain-containing protein 12-like [Limulus polyphemus]XP_022242925.1 coiled-coil domain-containing protein 12-like [Limulus polyphemus]
MSENEIAYVGDMEEKGIERRGRIKALKRKFNQAEKTDETSLKNDTENSVDSVELTEIPLPKPVFRSYRPQHDSLNSFVLENAKPESVDEQIQDHLAAGKPEPLIQEVDLATLAPRKPDWDLKRDVAKKLEKLERKTQRAIAELIRERLKSGDDDDLANVVNVGANVREAQDVDSDED